MRRDQNMNDPNRVLAGQRIGLFGRGGSGKSTCAVLLAQALVKAGYAVCVVDPSYAGIRAAATMKTMLDQMRAGFLPATGHLSSPVHVEATRRAYREARTKGALCVLNKAPDAETEHLMRKRLTELQVDAAASIREEPELRQSWLEGKRIQSAAAEAEAVKIVRVLEQRCAATGRPQPGERQRPSDAPVSQAV